MKGVGFVNPFLYIHGMEIKVMINKELIFKAVGLFYMTIEMDHMDGFTMSDLLVYIIWNVNYLI
jgi:hypothetical protein